jgi:hypothetical protein
MSWVFDYWRQLPDTIANEIWEIGLGVFTERVERIFDMEGDPAWDPISTFTVEERDIVGYDPDPILQRAGILRDSLTIPDMWRGTYHDYHVWFKGGETIYGETHRTGNVQDHHQEGPGTHSYRFGTLDDRFYLLSEGSDDMPGRDMVPMDSQRREVGVEIESRVVRKMNAWSIP